VLHALGVGLEQALQYVGRCTPTFEEFERWIIATAGEPEALQVQRVNAAEIGDGRPEKIGWRLREFEANAPVLSADDLAFWGSTATLLSLLPYRRTPASGLQRLVLMRVGANGRRPGAWYGERTNGVMVQYFQHPALYGHPKLTASPRGIRTALGHR
jgi:hypothetical protein